MSGFLSSFRKFILSQRDLLKKDPFPLFAVLLVLMLCDQILKRIFLHFSLKTDSFLGFALDLTPNKDFILSLEITTDHLFKTIIITPIFVWVVFFYFLSVYYIPKEMNSVKWGWTLAVSGALSNMADKLRAGSVLDIFAFQVPNLFHLYFNFADLIQLTGWVLLIYGAVKYRELIWRAIEKRKTLIILKKEQWRFVSYVMWTAFCFGLFFFVINSQFFLKYAESPDSFKEQFLLFTFKYFAVVMALFLFPVLVAFIYLSNKIYGPIYAFERYVRSLMKSENPESLQFRKGDHLKRLEVLAGEIKEYLKT